MAKLSARFVFACAIASICVLGIKLVNAGDAIPVFLWGGQSSAVSDSNPVNPFLKTSPEEFHEILASKLENSQPPLLLFLKENLCVEDITQHNEILRATTSSSTWTYLPAVEGPLSVFEELPLYNRTYEEDIDNISDGQLAIMSITDLHTISDVYKSMKESHPHLIAALTGKSCSYSRFERIKRAAVEPDNSTELYILDGRILFYASERPYIMLPNSEKYVQLPKPTPKTSDSPLSLTLTFSVNMTDMYRIDIKIQFLNNTSGYYDLRVLYTSSQDTKKEIVLEPSYDISFPTTFSYHCSPSIVFKKDSISLKFTDFQVQVDAKTFSDAYDCIGFTSIPIWSGIFVTAILALIMAWALSMIMDIRTMDRFDDPKGKTISISAQE